jgi:hypothetical protein
MTVLGKHNLGLRLATKWSWQRTVKFYVKLGLWVYMWKRNLDFIWDPETPAPHIEIGPETAALSVPLGNSHVTLLRAYRRGDRLRLKDAPAEIEEEKRIGEAYWLATSTLSLALALEGWPLVRSRAEWRRSYYADAGAPEALAYNITIWEAWEKHMGWIVDTPRIPGLEYPTWEEFQARWKKEERRYLKKAGGKM